MQSTRKTGGRPAGGLIANAEDEIERPVVSVPITDGKRMPEVSLPSFCPSPTNVFETRVLLGGYTVYNLPFDLVHLSATLEFPSLDASNERLLIILFQAVTALR